MPELSCRQLTAWITDNMGFSASESTVYRILRREGLVKRAETRLAASKEYHRKTTGPHQMWATDASYFRVVGWGYYYMVTVMDDHSRFILAHRLQRDMTSDSLVEVVQEAVDRTGMDRVPVEDRTRLLSDNGPGYVSRAFRDYLIHVNYFCRFLLPHRKMLPNIQPLLIDAHVSDVSQSFLIDLTLFG